jgi:cyclopropane-fatty-acyl-phospholipid synthase
MASSAQRLLAFDHRLAEQLCRELLARAGIAVGGDRPWDLRVHDDRFYQRAMRDGALGVGEAYVEGWWDCDAVDQATERACRAGLPEALRHNWMFRAHGLRARLMNLQAVTHSFENGQRHYDLGNDLYEAMLDARMIYTCGYWHDAEDLQTAQEHKLDLVCRKLGLRPGMRVLELGCGWGGFAAFAAERYQVEVVGYTVAAEQVRWAHEHYPHLPIDIRLGDYRSASGRFDAVVSIGMMEHVGPKNHRSYMELVDRCLAAGGIAFVHTIGANRANYQLEPWFDKYIFPNAVIPSLSQVLTAMEGLFVCEDVQNIGEHYDPTLMAWWHRFDAAWPTLRARYGDSFYRKWKYYLLASAGAFRARAQQLFQIVMTRPGTPQPATVRG